MFGWAWQPGTPLTGLRLRDRLRFIVAGRYNEVNVEAMELVRELSGLAAQQQPRFCNQATFEDTRNVLSVFYSNALANLTVRCGYRVFEDCRVKALAAALREGEGGARDVAALARTRDMEGASAKRRGAYSPWGLVSAGAERATLESQLRGALRALGDHIVPGTDAARILEELGGDLDSVDQLHSQEMEPG